jgi:hypothetical protein
MSTPFIRSLIACIPVCPKPLFHDDVDSNDSHVGDDSDSSDNNTLVVKETKETMPTQGPEASGKVENLVPSIGLLDPEGYVDVRAPWVEGLRGEKVCRSGMNFGSSLTFCSTFTFRWRII